MIRTFHTVEALARAGAELFARTAQDAAAARGRFTLALSGGHSPQPIYRLLNARPAGEIPWADTFVFWSDERYVPLDDPRSNAGRARELLLNHVPVPSDHVFPIYDATLSPQEAAIAYEQRIRRHFGEQPPRFDLLMLGCGQNGHTASLFPGSELLGEKDRLAATVKLAGEDMARVTLTFPLINLARIIVIVAHGAGKAAVVNDVIAGPRRPTQFPVQLVQPSDGNLYWLLDTEAASRLVSPTS